MIRTKHFALQWGYAFWCDMEAGFTLCLFARRYTDAGPYKASRYKLTVEVGWNWRPTIVWREEAWRINEPGTIRGMPLARPGVASSAWTGRARSVERVYWDRASRWGWIPDD